MKKAEKPIVKKIKRAVFIINTATTIIVTAKKIYDLVPKYEKFEGVDADKLVETIESRH